MSKKYSCHIIKFCHPFLYCLNLGTNTIHNYKIKKRNNYIKTHVLSRVATLPLSDQATFGSDYFLLDIA